ncbi:MAG: hypothetical protein ACTSQ5_15215, partial [Promethearchaeota archaeon]
MVPSSIIYLPMLILQAETRAVILYVSIFASLVILGYIWYLLFHSNRKEIQIQVPIYPFFQSVGGTAEEKINGTLQSDKLTRPINKTSLELGFNEFIDRSMYSYPDPPSKFL